MLRTLEKEWALEQEVRKPLSQARALLRVRLERAIRLRVPDQEQSVTQHQVDSAIAQFRRVEDAICAEIFRQVKDGIPDIVDEEGESYLDDLFDDVNQLLDFDVQGDLGLKGEMHQSPEQSSLSTLDRPLPEAEEVVRPPGHNNTDQSPSSVISPDPTTTIREKAKVSQHSGRLARMLAKAILIPSTLVACLIFAAYSIPVLLGFETMIVTSDSMKPTIRAGDAVLIKEIDPESIQVGDIITFSPPEDGLGMVTHRVVDIKEVQGSTYFQTKGDANTTPDPNLSPAEAVYGNVSFTLPKFGHLLSFSMTVWGKVLLFSLPVFVLVGQEFSGLLRGRKPGGATSGRLKIDEPKLNEA